MSDERQVVERHHARNRGEERRRVRRREEHVDRIGRKRARQVALFPHGAAAAGHEPDDRTRGRRLQRCVRVQNQLVTVRGVSRGPLAQQAGEYLTERRFQTAVLAGFALVALAMAAVGIFGLIQYSIATRTREIGLRMAVSARTGDIFRMIVGEGLALSLAGTALGLLGAWWLGRAVAGLLFGVAAGDPLTFVAVSLLLTAVLWAYILGVFQ